MWNGGVEREGKDENKMLRFLIRQILIYKEKIRCYILSVV